MGRPRAAIVAVTAAASLGGWWLGTARAPTLGSPVVTAVVDGDTIEVRWPGRSALVRLLNVDAPETVHPRRPVECFGPEAAAFTREALLGRRVHLDFDRVRVDRYGRLLAHVSVDGRRVGEELLSGGYARLMIIPPNGARGRSMLDLELAARSQGRGLWGAC